jgi:hypothetical protein
MRSRPFVAQSYRPDLVNFSVWNRGEADEAQQSSRLSGRRAGLVTAMTMMG